MSNPFDYAAHVSRNTGYVSDDVQEKVRNTRLLIAGCGIGSSVAVCAARMGFQHFVLVDGDTVSAHNLNRQFYNFADIGRTKVEALSDAILAINPSATVERHIEYLTAENTAEIVDRSDIIFDTVDFLDLAAIEGLHSAARQQGKPIFTALSVGFGALVWYFPADTQATLPSILAQHSPQIEGGGPDVGGSPDAAQAASAYATVFSDFITRLVPYLDQEVVQQISHVLTQMRDNKPCPASQVAVGSFAIAAMAMTMILNVLAGQPVPASPKLVVHSFRANRTQVVDLGESG